MHRLARLRSRATIALTLFVMALASMVLAPLVHPASYELVCSSQGSHFVDVSGAGQLDGPTQSGHADPGAHCPLCMPAGVSSSTIAVDFTPVQPLAFARRSIPAARLAGLVGAPLPARGPPVLS